MRKTEKGKEIKVYQSNPIIQARKHYGIMEHRLFRLAVADLRPKLKNSLYYDDEFRAFHMGTREVADLFQREGIDREGIYKALKKACKNMFDSHFELEEEGGFELCHVFEKIRYSKSGGLEIQFHKDMKKLLLELEHGNYTRSLLKLAFSLSSTYALILLELMLQYQGMQKGGAIERDLSMEELRFSMDVPENAYGGRIDNFRRFVIDAAIHEINEKTDYFIEPKYGMLRGRYNKVTGFHFVLRIPTGLGQEPPADGRQQGQGIEERLKKFGIHWSTAKRLAKTPHAEECLQIAIDNIQKAKNPAAYIKAAIEQDWHGQREAVRMALEQERMGENGMGADFADEDAGNTGEHGHSLEEIAGGDSPFSEMARRILGRRLEAAPRS